MLELWGTTPRSRGEHLPRAWECLSVNGQAGVGHPSLYCGYRCDSLAPCPEKHQDCDRGGTHVCHDVLRHHLPPKAPEDPHGGGIQGGPGTSETAAHHNEPLSEHQHEGLQHELHLHPQTPAGAGQRWPGRAAQGRDTGLMDACPPPSPHGTRTFSPWGGASGRTSRADSLCTRWTSLMVSGPWPSWSSACSSGPRPVLCPQHTLRPVSHS